MTTRLAAGDAVHTPLGKGVVRELRGTSRLVVEVKGRAVVFDVHAVTPVQVSSPPKRRTPETAVSGGERAVPATTREIDLHGFGVEEALVRVDDALNEALLDDVAEVRLIHGKGGRRIRDAVHRRLREIAAVRAFRIDSRNAGVTIVHL